MKYLIWVCMIAGFAAAQEIDPRVHLETAVHVQEQDPAYAIELYSEVLELSDVDADRYVAALNRGALILQQDDPDLTLATDSLRMAGRFANDTLQRRDAMFTLGLALHRGVDSSGQLMMDPEQIGGMIDQLRIVERAFLEAARSDSAHVESKKNVERLRIQIQQLEDMKEQIEQQQEQQQQQQQGEDGEQSGGEGQQDMADRLQDLADQQREQAQQSESAGQGEHSDQQQRQEQQEELSEQTQQANEDADEETQQEMQDAMDAQRQAEEALERGDNETAAQKQQEAADALERAAQRARESQQEQESEQQENQQGQQAGQPQEEIGEDGEPIDELAQRLLDKEREERERRQVYRATGQPVRVKEDW